MGENDNKYGQYFYGSVPAEKKSIYSDSVKKRDLISEGSSEIKLGKSNIKPIGKMEFISGGKSYDEKNSNQIVDPALLRYPESISQNSDILSMQKNSYQGERRFIQENRPITEEQMIRNASNSVGKKESIKISDVKEKDVINVFGSMPKPVQKAVAGICVAVVFFLGASAAKTVDDFKDSSKVDEYVEQYDDAYSDNRFMVNIGSLDANGDPYYDYDTLGMGRDIAASEDPEAALYAVYSGGDYMKYDVTHAAFAAAKEANPEVFGESKNFTEYATSLGCVDKDGKIDYDLYEQKTEARLLAKQQLQENAISEVSIKQ